MNISLQTMTLRNFKGIRNLTINFADVTNIYGENATGKTTIADAYFWLLFGKNSEDKKDFEVKTLDENNQPIHKLDHEVSATLLCNGNAYTLKRTYREKWTKKRGFEETEFTGHETIYEFNGVPKSQKEYQNEVSALLDESIAKLVTNPLYFNSLKWEERRKTLIDISGGVSDSDIAQGNEAFTKLLSAAAVCKNLDEYKKQVKASQKKIKEELEGIPTRIDEADRSKPEEQDWIQLSLKIATKEEEIAAIDTQLTDSQKAYAGELEKIKEIQKARFDLEKKLAEVKNTAQNRHRDFVRELEDELNAKSRQLEKLKRDKEDLERTINERQLTIKAYEKEMADLRNEWTEVNKEALVIDPSSLCCPACKQNLPADKIEETRNSLEKNFTTDKVNRLAAISAKGKTKSKFVEELTARINESKELLKAVLDAIPLMQANFDADYKLIQDRKNAPIEEPAEVKLLNEQIAKLTIPTASVVDNTDLKALRSKLTQELDALKQQLTSKDQIARSQVRIDELKAREKELSQMLATLEKTEFNIDAFNKAKIDAVEQLINNRFKVVKFKMYEQQINGGETECCICMVNGVPYPDVNTAGKINAGIDIINALTEHYNITAPIFIDNRESVNNLLPTNSQVINLVVSKDKKLRFDTVQSSATAQATLAL